MGHPEIPERFIHCQDNIRAGGCLFGIIDKECARILEYLPIEDEADVAAYPADCSKMDVSYLRCVQKSTIIITTKFFLGAL